MLNQVSSLARQGYFLWTSIATILAVSANCVGQEKFASDGPRLASVGQQIFFDRSLSHPEGQSCAACHQARHAFADPRPVSVGAVGERKGTRNAPSLMYASLIPSFAFEDVLLPDGNEVFAWEGGLFHDGRARDLFEQVQAPFLASNEMNLDGESALASRLRSSAVAAQLQALVGTQYWMEDRHVAYMAYRCLVEFLKEPVFRPFDAAIDDYLAGDKSALNSQQTRGLRVFREHGKCADCHLLTPTNWRQPLLSDFAYDNLGIPSRGKKDPGLAAQTESPEDLGKFRAPSLRNVALTAPYMHNGTLATLREVVEFYNKRDVTPSKWGDTDYPMTVNRNDLGDLKLTPKEVDDLVAFMDAFTDRSLLELQSSALEETTPKIPARLPKWPADTPPTRKIEHFFPDWSHRLHPVFKVRQADGRVRK